MKVEDFKGEVWNLRFITCQIDKRTGLWNALWSTPKDTNPDFLNKNGARYDFIPTPVFTEWFYPYV